MGAWGEKAFENDSALDWLNELRAEGPSAIRAVLRAVAATDRGKYLDLDDAAAAVGAAEIVAAAVGKGRDRVPGDVIAWIEANSRAIVSNDVALAARAVERVLGGNSELNELWSEESPDSAWHAEVRELLRRLGGDPTSSPPAGGAPAGGAGESRHQEQWKAALLTFLQIRGLEPDAHERARIEASRDDAEIRAWLARAPSAGSVEEVLDDRSE